MIIAIEGIDGAGKNTLTQAVEQELIALEAPCARVGFPRYAESIHAQLAQDALYGKMGDTIESACAMATLFALDRQEIAEELRSLDNDGYVILIDRYVASNAAYTAARTHGIMPHPQTSIASQPTVEWVEELEFQRLGIPYPDMQILVNTSPELAQSRASSRAEEDSTRAKDSYEKDSALQSRTAQAYQELADNQWVSPWLVVTSEQAGNADFIQNMAADIVAELMSQE